MTNTKPGAARPPLPDVLGNTTAAVTTLASIAFTTWAVADMAMLHAEGAAPVPIAIVVGLAVEMVWLYVLTQEWAQASQEGQVSKGLSLTGWALAGVAAAIIVTHGVLTWAPMAVLAVLPVGAKAAWHWRTKLKARAVARRLAEEEAAVLRARELSTDPNEEEELRLAEQARQLEVARRQAELDRQRAEQEHEDEIARIEREGREELARARAHFTVAREVQRNDREIGYQQAPTTRIALGSGLIAPDDASSVTGFGSAMASARQQVPTVRTGSDQEVPGVPGGGAGPQVHPSVLEAEQNRTACATAFAQLLAATQETPSIAAVATAAKVSERAAGRHLRKLGLIPPAATTE